MSVVSTERVLVVPTQIFRGLGHFQGFSIDSDRYLATLLSPSQTSYMARSEAETDPAFKQLIPYCIFQHRDAAGKLWLFQYTRGKGQGEGRLHLKRSIGIGGHISADDHTADAELTYQQGMQRELAEEVAIDSEFSERCVGLINDDESEVGRVHLGVVHLFELDQPAVRSLETDIIEAGFVPVADLLADPSRLETWSKICLTALFGDA